MSAGRYNGGELTKALLKTFVAIMSHLNLIFFPSDTTTITTEAVEKQNLTNHLPISCPGYSQECGDFLVIIKFEFHDFAPLAHAMWLM